MILTVETMEPNEKVQKWIESITSDMLETVAIESMSIEDWNPDPKLNKMIFKALLCLSHTAYRAQPSQIQIGKYIFCIADNLCLSLTEIPDLIKYLSGLYHIILKLIAMKLYTEATKITTWSLPSKFVQCVTSQHLDMYPKLSNLWHEPAIKLINDLPYNFNTNGHKLLLELLSNEFSVLEVIAKERSSFVLSKVLTYLIKLETVIKDVKVEGSQSHRNIVMKFLDKIEIVLEGEEKYDVYHNALKFINCSANAMVSSESKETALAVFTENCKMMETIFRRNLELKDCFMIYKNMCLVLFKPNWDLELIKKETLNIIGNFSEKKAISWNMRMIGYIIQTVFDCWEKSIGMNDEVFLKGGMMRDILDMIKLMIFVLNSIPTNGCEICQKNSCKMKKHVHTVSLISVRYMIFLRKISANDLLKDMLTLVKEPLEDIIGAIFEMKEAECAQWKCLWNNCGIYIYNLGVVCSKTLYEETAYLFSLLFSCIVKFEGINTCYSVICIKDPVSHVLHKLSSVHFNHGNYREAMTTCALNGLLSYQNSDSKAFRLWASIKQACENSQTILKMTMLACLKEDMDVISEIGGNVILQDYNLCKLCIRELGGLYEARCNFSLSMQCVLEELQILNCEGLEYAQGVHMYGYHLLNFQYDNNLTRHLNLVTKKYKEYHSKQKWLPTLYIFVGAIIDFFIFVIDLHKIVDRTKSEMETMKFALQASKSVSHDGRPRNSDTVIPSNTKINVTEDAKLFESMQRALNNWGICIDKPMLHIVEEWYLVLTLRTLVIVGEYCRLHKYTTLETKAWKIAFMIAQKLTDSHASIRVIGRSISLRNVNFEWLDTGNKLTSELESFSTPENDNTISIYWLSLANLYFDIGEHKTGAEMLQKVLSLSIITPYKNLIGYLWSSETAVRNYPFCSNDNQSTKSMVYIVRCLYAMIPLMEYSPQPKIGIKEKLLYSLELLLTCTSSLALRMNSMLSFREISSHVINRLKLSQSSGLALRVAECLKNLCFIDLSRMQLDHCVVKVEGLEHILQTEYIDESKNAKNPKTSTNELEKPGARDTRVNDTSPVFKKTVFKLPEFLTHEKCLCYKCSCVDYQYLVLACTHIRAQLYFLQGHLKEAKEHFEGAFILRGKMLEIEVRNEINWQKWNEKISWRKQHLWKDYYRTVEYVLLLLDFSRFIRELEFDDGLNVAVEAVNFCQKFHLEGHPVHIAAKELVLEYQFCNMFNEGDFNKFTVPDASSIDINRFLHTPISLDSASIATPASKSLVKKPKTIRRNKTPPLLKLTKVSMILSDDEDEDEPQSQSQSPKSSRQRAKIGKNYRRQNSLTRKKLQQYLEAPSDLYNADNANKIEKSEIEKGQDDKSELITKATSVFPCLSKQRNEVLDKKGMSDEEKIQRVSNTEPKTKTLDYGRRCKSKSSAKLSIDVKSQSANKDQDDVIDELVTSFKETLVSNRDGKFIQNVHQASGSDTLSIDKSSKKRLEYPESPEKNSTIDFEEFISKFPKREYNQQTERVRTSDRIKRSVSESSKTKDKKSDVDVQSIKRSQNIEGKEKSKCLAKNKIKNFQDVPDSGNGDAEIKTKDSKQKVQNFQRIEKSQSEICNTISSALGNIESFQLDDPDIIHSTVLEERAQRIHKYQTRTSSRIMRSQSQVNGPTSKLNNIDNAVSTSHPEELVETKKSSNAGGVKSKLKASSRAKKPDVCLDAQPVVTVNSQDNQEDQKLKILKEPEAVGKKQVNKRPTTGRSNTKLKR